MLLHFILSSHIALLYSNFLQKQHRFVILRKLRHNLLRYDAASERIAASSNRSVNSSKSRSSRSKGSKKSDRMTEPLIESSDEEAQDYNYEDYY